MVQLYSAALHISPEGASDRCPTVVAFALHRYPGNQDKHETGILALPGCSVSMKTNLYDAEKLYCLWDGAKCDAAPSHKIFTCPTVILPLVLMWPVICYDAQHCSKGDEGESFKTVQ